VIACQAVARAVETSAVQQRARGYGNGGIAGRNGNVEEVARHATTLVLPHGHRNVVPLDLQ